MLVGEAPGPQEDLQGRPFVGPAGKLLHQALEELRLNPKEIYITNAVKHFKFLQQGSKRLNKNPLLSEVSACRPWLLAEIDAINPHIILCLGTSASKSLLGSSFALMRNRGKVLSSPYADRVMATIHPSAILHARDRTSRKELYQYLRDDLELAYRLSRQHNR
jgi:DNA polymerase